MADVPPAEKNPSSLAIPELSRWFDDEVLPHEPELKGYLRRSFPAVRDVEDVVQESYVRILQTHPRQAIASARAFLFTVARRLALNLIDRQKNAATIDVGDFSVCPVLQDGASVSERVSREEVYNLLGEALSTLPARCREITVLRKLQGLSQREVAACLGLSEKTVAEQVARGVRRCEKFLRRRGITSSREP
jgi:RNA polymerase sigma factor (sigma-70 family)